MASPDSKYAAMIGRRVVELDRAGDREGAVGLCRALVDRFGTGHADPAVRVEVARAFRNEGVGLHQLGRPEQALGVLTELVDTYAADGEQSVRHIAAEGAWAAVVISHATSGSGRAFEISEEFLPLLLEVSRVGLPEQVFLIAHLRLAKLAERGRLVEALAAADEFLELAAANPSPVVAEKLKSVAKLRKSAAKLAKHMAKGEAKSGQLVSMQLLLEQTVDSWVCKPAGPGPAEAELAFMRSCAALHTRLCELAPHLAHDVDAVGMLQGIAVREIRPRVGSRMPSASEAATPGLSIGTAEAIAAARLAAAGNAHDVMVATSIMSHGLDGAPWDHIPGTPGLWWVLPAICSALSPEKHFSRESFDRVPPTRYWYYGNEGTLWFRLGYEIWSLVPGRTDDERRRFWQSIYPDYESWALAHEFDPDNPDPARSSTFDESITNRALQAAQHALGKRPGRDPEWENLLMDGLVRDARSDGHDSRETLQAAHLYYWASQESHLLLDAHEDLDAVVREHPWIAQWYPAALEDPGSCSDPIWPPDKAVLVRELDERLSRAETGKAWAEAQTSWRQEGAFNVESGSAVVTASTDYVRCDCWDNARLTTRGPCELCGRPAGSLVATSAGGGDGIYPVRWIADDQGVRHGAIAYFGSGLMQRRGRDLAPAKLVDVATPWHCGVIENTGELSFCDANTGTDQPNMVVSVALPPGAYHVVVWEGDNELFQALAAYDEAAMAALRDLVGDVGPKVWD